MSALAETQSTLARLAAQVGPAVAGVGRGWGVGSGVVVRDGLVLAAAHAIAPGAVALILGSGGAPVAGRLLGADPDLDLAVVEADTAGIAPVTWDPDAPPPGIGTAVAALADPGGRGLRVTPGFVSALRRGFRGPRGRRVAGGIEHTAPLPRGSAGGPLVDLEGRLLGLNAVRLEGGLIVALPADRALRDRVDAIARGEADARPRLGAAVAPPHVARRLRRAVGLPERDGVLVRGVEPEGPGGAAGLRRGDLIVAAAGAPVDSVDALHGALDAAGDGLALTVLRGTEEIALDIRFPGGEGEARR